MDPRIARTRAGVLRAATDLLVESGPSAVTVDAVVARSGVAKSTIYRHWDTRDDLLVATIERCAPRIERPDESLPFEEALRALVADLGRILADPEWARVLPALIALRQQAHGVADLEQRMEARQDAVVEGVLRRGVAEGRLVADLDVEQASTVLVGPLLYACLLQRPAIDDALLEHVLEVFLRAYGTGLSSPRSG